MHGRFEGLVTVGTLLEGRDRSWITGEPQPQRLKPHLEGYFIATTEVVPFPIRGFSAGVLDHVRA
jgi:hypothetical protein